MKQNYIAGEWIDGPHSTDNVNPSDTTDVIGRYARASAEQLRQATAAASAAALQWAQTGPQQRADALDRIGSELITRREELGTLLAREEGKTIAEGIGEASRAGNIFKFFAQESLRLTGEKLASVRPGIEVEVTREPVGTVGIIAPWNFPLAIPAWKIAPALAYGNAVVFKPAELVPGCAWALTEIISRADLPAGTFNLVMGTGREVGQSMLDDPNIDAISFTGSTGTGACVAQSAVRRMGKFQLEMGGKNPLVVLDDADLAVAVDCALQGSFFSAGQRCTASSRIIVEKGLHPRFVRALVERMAQLKVGHALDTASQIGPVVSTGQLEQNLSYVAIGRNEGATLAFGGERLSRATKGHYFAPTLFTDCDNAMRICREEIFGPVAAVVPADNFEHALMLANDTNFGLCAGLCTTSLQHARHFKRNAQAGMVMINVPTAGVDYHVPFGGTKASSYGAREQGQYAAEFYTCVKTTYIS